MAGNGTPVSTLATRITIDDMQAVESLRGIKNQVSSLMNSWKAQNAMLQSVGDHLGAAKAKYEGLGDAIKKQEEYIAKLKSEMETVDTSTNKGSEAYAQLTKQLSLAEKQLANLNAQQERAKKSMDYYASGADKVKTSLKEMTTSSNLMIEKLKAEGKTYQANYEQSRLYANQLSKMSTLQSKLKSSLNSIAEEQGKESDAYKRTAMSLQRLDTEMAKTRSAQAKLNESFSSTNLSVAKIHDNYNKISKSVGQVGSGVKEMAGKVVSAGATAGVAVAGLSAGFIAASKSASEMQNTYRTTANLLETGGEKVADVTKNVAQMQRDGRKYSLEYGKSQQEIAEAYQDLVKRGDTSKQALGAMRSEIQASVASGDDLKDVTEVTSNVMESFGMKVDKNGKALESTTEMTKRTKIAVNDLAYAADKTSTNFQDLGVGMSYVGATAHGAGISLSETASAMGVLSNNGLEADKAGTGLRKVINSLSSAVKNIDSKDSPLKKLGITKNDLVDSKGNLKRLSDVMAVLGEKTKNMGTAEKNVVFNSLFGTTGQQAGQILADNANKLRELNKEVANSSKNNYVGKLAEKNMGSAQNAMNRFKMAAKDVQMTLASAVLPTVSQLAESLSHVVDSKGFRGMMKTVSEGISTVGNKLQGMFRYIDKNSAAFTSMGKSVATIIGEFGSGVWTTFSGVIKGISKSILNMFGDKSTGNAAKDLSKALADIASHKQAIKIIGETFATYFVAKKFMGVASALLNISKGISGIGKAVKSIKDGESILDVITGIKGKGKLEKDAVEGAEDIAKSAAKGAEKSVGKSSIFKKLTYKPKHMSSDVARDAEDLAKGAGKAAEKGVSKGSFFKNIFSKTAPAEQTALESGTRLAGKIGSGLNIGLSVIDIGRSLFEKGGGKKKYEDVGSSVGSAIGTGVGMAFGGPVGGMVGGMIGQVVGKWGGDIAHKTVQAWNKAGGWKGITKNVKSVLSEMGKDMQRGAKNIASTASKMGSDLSKSISSATKKASKNWNSFWKDAESIAKKTPIGKTVQSTWNGITKTIQKATKQNEKDVSNSEKNKSKLISSGSRTRTKDIQRETNDIVKAINNETKLVTKAANQEYKDRVSLANKQYSAVVKKADQTRDQTVKAANDKYNRVVKAANDEYSGTDKASTQQRDAVIAHAKKQRDNTVSAANDQRDKVVKHAENQRDSSINAAEKQKNETISKAETQRDKIKDAATSQSQGVVEHMTHQANSTMKANSEQAGGLGKIWESIVSFFNKLTKPFGVKGVEVGSLSASYSTIGGLAYASGGGVSDSGKALVGEAGPELRYKPYSGKFDILGAQGAQLADLEAGDEILNADDTAKLLSGNFKGTLPGYAKGTSNLSDFIKKVKDKAGDIFDDIKDDALKAIKDIGNPIDKLKDIAKKAFNLDSVKDLGNVPHDISKGAVDKSIKSISDFISKLKDEVTNHIDSENASLDSNSTSPQATGDHKHWVQQAGIPMKYWDDVNYIVSHESGWNPHATNPSSGAYGLPQSLPAGKMAAAGKDWRDNPITQLKWMYSYVNSDYGGFPQAHAFWISHHAYANGGIANEPSIFGEDGPEMAIPLASPKRSRGYELLGKVVSMFAADEPSRGAVNTTDNSRVEELLEQNNALMQALINIANGQLTALNSGNTNTQVAKSAFYNAFGMDQKRTNFQSI